MTCQETSEGVLAFHPSVNILNLKKNVISKVDDHVCMDIPDWILNIIVFRFLLYELMQVVKGFL